MNKKDEKQEQEKEMLVLDEDLNDFIEKTSQQAWEEAQKNN